MHLAILKVNRLRRLADRYVLLLFEMALLLIKTKTHIKVNKLRILNYRVDTALSKMFPEKVLASSTHHD